MGKVIGIDLGTTNSVAAVADGPSARVLDNKDNKSQTRSIIGVRKRKGKEDEILVGDVAFNNWPLAPKDTVISIKRLMGRGVADKEVQKVRGHYQYQVVEPEDGTKDSVRVVMAGKQYSPVEISALILRKIKEDAEFRLGDEVTDAVITVPAYFSQAQKAATRTAGQKAGLRVIKILDEPTAAAIAFGMDSAVSTDPKYICVYDLGGGTFDISILMWAGNVFAPLNLEGDMWLGGDNFDQVLVAHVLEYIGQEYALDKDPRTNLRFMAELAKAAKEAKERLTTAKSTDIILAGLLPSDSGDLLDVELEVTRSQFEDMSRPLVEKSIALVRKALKGTDLTPEQIDYVVLAGNASCMPIVQEAVEELFGPKKIKREIHPKNCVAIGAAKVAAVLRDRIVCQAPKPGNPEEECSFINKLDAKVCEKCGTALELADKPIQSDEVLPPGGIAPFSYGVQLAGDRYSVFVKKNDPFPTESPKPQTFFTLMPNQRIVAIPVYAGDNMERASVNEKQGDVYAILPPGLPKGTAIRVKVWLDSDGVFDLSAHLEDGTDLHPLILKGEADARAMEALQKVEAEMEKKVKELPPDEIVKVEQIRDQAFDAIKKKDFDKAVDLAQKADELIHRPPDDSLRTKAENLAGFVKFILHQYGWALDAGKTYRLNQLAEEVSEALSKGDQQALERKVAELDRETDNLPQEIVILMNMRGAIHQVVGASDPAMAARMIQELDQAEEALKAGNPRAAEMLSQLAVKLQTEMAKGGPSKEEKCQCGHTFAAGELVCPKCKLPRHLLGGGEIKTSSGFTNV